MKRDGRFIRGSDGSAWAPSAAAIRAGMDEFLITLHAEYWALLQQTGKVTDDQLLRVIDMRAKGRPGRPQGSDGLRMDIARLIEELANQGGPPYAVARRLFGKTRGDYVVKAMNAHKRKISSAENSAAE